MTRGARLTGATQVGAAAGRSFHAVQCAHDGYRGISTTYDRHAGVLVFHWACDQCGARLDEVSREPYRPRFLPNRGKDHLARLSRPLTP
jgi:hypothetical protein